MRDHRKDINYFNTFINEDSLRVEDFLDAVESGEVAQNRIIPVKAKVHDLKLGLLIAKYSKGDQLPSLENEYLELIAEWEEVWEPDYYDKNIQIISLGVLFETGAELAKNVRKKLEQSGIDDWLYNYLLDSLDGEQTERSREMLLPELYSNLQKAVYEEDKISFLKKYLSEDWYNEDYDCYEAHKSKYNIYYGYWSFEAGAVAKILNIDDAALKDMPYYPYDLVHYKIS